MADPTRTFICELGGIQANIGELSDRIARLHEYHKAEIRAATADFLAHPKQASSKQTKAVGASGRSDAQPEPTLPNEVPAEPVERDQSFESVKQEDCHTDSRGSLPLTLALTDENIHGSKPRKSERPSAPGAVPPPLADDGDFIAVVPFSASSASLDSSDEKTPSGAMSPASSGGVGADEWANGEQDRHGSIMSSASDVSLFSHLSEGQKPAARTVNFPSFCSTAGGPQKSSKNQFQTPRKPTGGLSAELTMRSLWTALPSEALEKIKTQFEVVVQSTNIDGQASRQIATRHSTLPERVHFGEGVKLTDYFKNCGTVLSPVGTPRLMWNLLSTLVIIYDLFMIPMQAFEVGENTGFQTVEWIATVFWTLDVLASFRTGYFIGSNIEMRPTVIALQYAKTWLLLDITIVTLEWVSRLATILGSASLLRTSRVLRAFRFCKLLRLAKMRELWTVYAEQINNNAIHLVSTMAGLSTVLVVLIHIVSCAWYAIGTSEPDGWVTYDAYTGTKDTAFWYIASARWVIAQLNGRTDINEMRNMPERGFTCVVGVTLAVLAQAVFISVITKAMLDLSELMSDQTRRNRMVNDYLDKFPVPPELVCSCKRYLCEFRDADKEAENEKMILSILPKHVQTQLLFEVRSPVIVAHSLFANLHQEFQWFMRILCRRVVKLVSAVKYEVVFDKGDACVRMLFMAEMIGRYVDVDTDRVEAHQATSSKPRGSRVLTSNSLPSAPVTLTRPASRSRILTRSSTYVNSRAGFKVPADSWICEPALWLEWLNKGRLVATHHGHMFGIDAIDLAHCLQNHPDAFALTVLYARAVVDEMRTELLMSDICDFSAEFAEICTIHLRVTVNSGNDLDKDGTLGKCDAYCMVKCVDMTRTRSRTAFWTNTLKDNHDPVWNHGELVSLSSGQCLLFELFKDNGGPDELLGQMWLEPDAFLPQGFSGECYLEGGPGHVEEDGIKQGSLTIKVDVEEIEGVSSALRRSLCSDGGADLAFEEDPYTRTQSEADVPLEKSHHSYNHPHKKKASF